MPLQYLKEITNNFSRERILGQGGAGVVYKGVQQNGDMIAVKKIVSTLMPGLQEQFENEVYHLMTLKHPNIVRCVGYCYEIQNVCLEYNGKYVFAEQAERLICLEYLPKGSLNSHLSDESSGLDWSTRYQIIKGVCNGLRHLHEQIDKPMLHLDLKPDNILLDNSMEPKITDFGLSRVLDQPQTIRTTSRDGTFGYMAPEFLHGGTITLKSDIFSLGVIILEIITGRREYPDIGTSSNDFIELALKKWRNALPRALGYRSLEIKCQQIKTCIQVGLICVNPERTKRPSITEIINMLQRPKDINCNIGYEATIPGYSGITDTALLIGSDMLKNLPNISHWEVESACEDFTHIVSSTTLTERLPISDMAVLIDSGECEMEDDIDMIDDSSAELIAAANANIGGTRLAGATWPTPVRE
ncbi:G-type lectin S-receptor-like serine/threonine-protein kinase SD1-13 [Triticum dicoccoides]|uniref:G-type lectin S-receptor-like serine/threonine-protein kinase SD1-13 n=1 Tax=Triticum dicoccoides TaxID=85692 RepID=UPI00188FD696|nr:G-type lectin S-receptor-like serine/threonine-protein kinase SD1-13 [Triticum dicoccoides]